MPLFDFNTNVLVLPGHPYCLEAVVESESDCTLAVYHFACPGGAAVLRGKPLVPVANMWFREGPILNFPRFTHANVARDESGRLFLTLSGSSGHRMVTECSTDLTDCTPFQTNLLTGDELHLVFTNTTAPQQYYRVPFPVLFPWGG